MTSGLPRPEIEQPAEGLPEATPAPIDGRRCPSPAEEPESMPEPITAGAGSSRLRLDLRGRNQMLEPHHGAGSCPHHFAGEPMDLPWPRTSLPFITDNLKVTIH